MIDAQNKSVLNWTWKHQLHLKTQLYKIGGSGGMAVWYLEDEPLQNL